MIDLDKVHDFANAADEEVGKYKIELFLSSKRLQTNKFEFKKLDWRQINYLDKSSFSKIPSDKRGIYDVPQLL